MLFEVSAKRSMRSRASPSASGRAPGASGSAHEARAGAGCCARPGNAGRRRAGMASPRTRMLGRAVCSSAARPKMRGHEHDAPLPPLSLPDGSTMPALRPGHLAHGREPRRACGRAGRAAPGAGARLPRLRHRRDVRRRRRRIAARRGASRPALRGPLRATSCSSSPRSTRTTPARRAWSPPASAACAGCGWTTSTCTCCTGAARCRCTRRVEGFERLQQRGLIRHWGVSNFDLDDLQRTAAVPGGAACAANQVWYSLRRRGVEFDLLPWQRAAADAADGLFADRPGRAGRACRAGRAGRRPAARTPAQLALAWMLAQPGVMAIPKSSDPAAPAPEPGGRTTGRWRPTIWPQLDRLFPPPRRKQPLAVG